MSDTKNPRKSQSHQGRIAIFAILLGNIASILGSVQEINKAISAMTSYRLLGQIYNNMHILVIVIFVGGYATGCYWLYKIFLSRKSSINKALLALCLLLFTAVAFSLNLKILPSPPTPEPILEGRLEKWSSRIFSGQVENGGIRVHVLDPSLDPQVWTTAQCLKAALSGELGASNIPNIKKAFDYIESARKTDPYEGWGLFEERDWTVTEIAGWVALSYVASVDSEFILWNNVELDLVLSRIERDLEHIASRQDSTGGWSPISITKPEFTRTYSTIIALWALVEARKSPIIARRIGKRYDRTITLGIQWLLGNFDENLGWVPNPHRKSQTERFAGLTAQTLFVLRRAERIFDFFSHEPIYATAKSAFLGFIEFDQRPIELNERVHDHDQSFRPTQFDLEGSTYLWFPWSFALVADLSHDGELSKTDHDSLRKIWKSLSGRVDELSEFVGKEFMYVTGESLFCVNYALEVYNSPDHGR